MKFKEYINEKYIKSDLESIPFEYDLPLYLYHSTYAVLEKDIMKNGLRTCNKYRGFNWCTNGVYLGVNKEFCLSFIDGAEMDTNIPEDWYGNFITFRVLTEKLQRNRLFKDPNWHVSSEFIESFIYKGIILPHNLEVYCFDNV